MPDRLPASMAAAERSAVCAPVDGLWREATAFLALAAPMVVSRIGVSAMSIADGLMLAHYSAEQLAVLGLADALVDRVLEVVMVFATAGVALAAQAKAAGGNANADVGVVWLNALMLAVVGGLLGLAFGAAGSGLLTALGQQPELARASGAVVFVLGLGALPALIAIASAGVLEAVGRPFAVAWAMVAANLLNVACNAGLIFGVQGLAPLGALGAAWSTTVVRVLLAVALVAAIWWLPERRVYGLRRRFDRSVWRLGREQRVRGWAGAANVFVLALLSLGVPVMAGWIGTDAVAQVTALWLALAAPMVVAWGVADAAGLRVAALYGRAHGPGSLHLTGMRLAGIQSAGVALAALLYGLAPREILVAVAHEPALVNAVLPLLPLGLAALLADGLSMLYSSMLRSLGVVRVPFVLHTAAGLALLPCAWGLAFMAGWGVSGLIAAHVLSSALRAIALGLLYERHAARIDRSVASMPAGGLA